MNDIENISGSLLGDASLRQKNKGGGAYYILAYAGESLHMDRMLQVRESLGGDDITIKPSKGKLWLWTRMRPEFLELYHQWYPNGKKVVPEGFTLQPKSLASFFMDDGSSSWLGIGVMVSFYAQGFTVSDIERLERLICEYGLNCYPNYGTPSEMPRLVIRDKSSVARFMDIVKPYITPSFEYKLKYPGHRTS